MKILVIPFVASLIAFLVVSPSLGGPFSPYTDNGVAKHSVRAWASSVESYDPAPGVMDTPGFPAGSPPTPNDDPTRGLGPADATTVSLGDLSAALIASGEPVGEITVAFAQPIFDGPGPDFAVFENAGTFFSGAYTFGELAFVEVSTNGADFARFSATSLNIEDDGDGSLEPNELDAPFGRAFAGIDTTNIHNLAGVHPSMIGTPFELGDLSSHTLVSSGAVDLSNIHFVKFVDVPGNGAFLDSGGNPILDAWESTMSGGFDLDAVGAINVVPEPNSLLLMLPGLLFLGRRLPVLRRSLVVGSADVR